MIQAKVNVVGGWGHELARTVNRRVGEELEEAAKVGAGVASRKASLRRRSGTMAQMELLDVEGTPTGWTGGFRSKAWYAHFQSAGTRRGIRPLHFLEDGAKAAKDELRKRLDRIG